MAVELRCPDCRAKLRLKVAPEAGTEVECPKCGTVFPAPEPEPEEDAPKKKAAEGEEKAGAEEKKKLKTRKGKGADGDPNAPRKRKAKKRETSKAALIGVISAGVLMLLCMTGTLIWFFSRTSKAVEMCYYVPEDAQSAIGLNIGHARKYPEFYKGIGTMLAGTDFKVAGDAIGKASGNTDLDGLADYMLKAQSVKSGWAIVYRTKAEFDGGDLAKLPGAEKRTADGKTYYSAPLLPGGQRGLVFAPTNRLVVVAPAAMDGQPAFKKMLNGHADSKDKTLGVRMGDLGKRVTRGTFWQMTVFDNDVKMESVLPPVTAQGGGVSSGDDKQAKKRQFFQDALNGTQGIGVKASLGSREIRFELIAWHKEAEKASGFAKKMKESELGKGDEGTPPTWFKDDTAALGDRKIAAQVLSNLAFGSSGELFYTRSSVDTVDLQQGGGIIGKVLGLTPSQGGGPGGMMGPQPGGAGGPMPGPPGGPPGGMGPMGPKSRRPGRVRARR